MIRKRPVISMILVAASVCCSSLALGAQPEKAENRVSVDSSAILESMMCVVRTNPWGCIRQQAARMLDNWDDILNAKKREIMEEADKNMPERAQNRGLGNDNQKVRITPSNLMAQIEDGLETISDFVSDGVDSYVSESKADNEEKGSGKPKTHLHHILHKLGNVGSNSTQESLARSVAEFEDVPAVADGLVDYGFGDGPEKAIGRGKRKGKKKKAFMKLFILGAALKGKIELLLKILSFHLQLKFFAVAVIGLLINIARFWIDLKRQPQPQKVIYYEHAQHQHHYDDHGEEYGGYWKRSLPGVHDDESGFYAQDRTDSIESENPHYRAGQYTKAPNTPLHYPYDPHNLAYQQQRPYA
ncbi:uncharacterized protein LOC129770111 isoform X2 [Toxorhynchites rutilus septentrionalis]|uniref:uncharacterized protein LOC129770111 isoform X2 n=1 Tax=Toxorhynchites rutilus septentrionalis TaxID=329112 RepID=UPI002478CA63|nr:uncharacterized protein LOC129770111 isoform X2 [Toxorhynchites rutilus septentrionalis]